MNSVVKPARPTQQVRLVYTIQPLCKEGFYTARFDMKNRVIDAGSYLRYPQGTAVVGQKLANGLFIDGATKSNFLYQLTNTSAAFFSTIIQR